MRYEWRAVVAFLFGLWLATKPFIAMNLSIVSVYVGRFPMVRFEAVRPSLRWHGACSSSCWPAKPGAPSEGRPKHGRAITEKERTDE